MAELPTYLSRESAATPDSPANARAGNSGTILAGRAISEAADTAANATLRQQEYSDRLNRMKLHQQNVISGLVEQKTKQLESLEVNQKVSQLRTDWNDRLIDYQQNPSSDMFQTSVKEYDEYTDKLVEGASTEEVRNQLALHASEYRIGFINETFKMQSHQQLAQFGATYDKMLSNAENSIFATKSLDELSAQKNLLNKTIDDAVKTGQIRDPAIIQQLRGKADLLAISWAESVLPENPDLVRRVINGEDKEGQLYHTKTSGVFDGVDVRQRSILLQKANEVQRTANTQEKLLLRESVESDKAQRIKTGEGNATNMDRFRKVFGDAYASSAERELFNATRLHSYYERAKGADGEALRSILQEAAPRKEISMADGSVATVYSIGVGNEKGEWVIPTVVDGKVLSSQEATKLWQQGKNPALGGPFKTVEESNKFAEEFHNTQGPGTYHEQEQLFTDVQQLVHQAQSDKKSDAFTYFSLHPSVRPYAQKVLDHDTPEGRIALRQAVLDLQKADSDLSPANYMVMPKGEAEKFISQFNSMIEVGNKQDGAGVRELLSNFHDQFGNNAAVALNQLSNTRGGDKIAPKINPLLWHINNPSTFRLIIDAIRKDPSEVYAKFATPKEKNNFLQEVNTDPTLMSYQSSVMASNNGSDAEHMVNGVRETFRDFSRDYVLNGGKLKDASSLFFSNYTFGELNGAQYARPRSYKDNKGDTHVMSEDDAWLSNNFLNFYPRTINPSTIAPESIVAETKYFTSEQLTKDVQNALRSNTFWSTTEDETGVYLFTKGTMAGTSRQVFGKDGKPVRVNFSDTIKSIPMLEFNQKDKPRVTPHTGDSIWERLADALISSG